MASMVKLGGTLFAITAVTGLILGGVHSVTSRIIEQRKVEARQAALRATLPDADTFSSLTDTFSTPITAIFEGKSAAGIAGWCFMLTPQGFGGPLSLVVGIDTEGRVKDISILESSETPGLGARASEPEFAGQFHDKLAQGDLNVVKTGPSSENDIQAISGATITSRAVTDAINEARAYWKDHLSGKEAGK